ncbi:MAG TPA: DegQ family serine endoprotease [Syntrophales bacterium]|nr:DegQ family serine endoprotease [Syntrophales bacterium]HOM07957.1 DegQ family serine endoprotease [Syntrophales bacterium]HOO00645.1 DegQ family serine endoprotease [Syntrophales bacterium]HPC01899.1 DegQ family serine endoprotease [Syntrophales bacterium]HRS87795.1 DegQ family serine endoprotease [Syntrophales bacterium]
MENTSSLGKKNFLLAIVAFTLVIAFLAAAGPTEGKEKGISRESLDLLDRINKATAEVAEAIKPSVVHISSTRIVQGRRFPSPFFNDPFFREFFGTPFGPFEEPRNYKQSGTGSGVIVSRDGHIVTNNHVVKDTDEIKVTLADRRVFKGKVLGSDPKTDLAVIKIEASDLPAAVFGDSDRLRVGERVIAVGNPFGLDQTVTSGIISFKGRADVGIADYEDFIQTDAPINPGNSGGALVNMRGELIGINTAIVTSSGGHQGIGFAIPSNMVKIVMEQLIQRGKVVRGWLGVTVQAVTPELAKQLGVEADRGALVGDVNEGSPADKAGIQRGDVIVRYDGKEVRDVTALKNMVAATKPGQEVEIEYRRNGKTGTVRAVIEEQKETAGVTARHENRLKGLTVQDLTAEIRRELDIPARIQGVVVVSVAEDSAAYGVLRKGDVIMEINRKKIKGVEEYEAVVSRLKGDDRVLLLVYRKGGTFYVSL